MNHIVTTVTIRVELGDVFPTLAVMAVMFGQFGVLLHSFQLPPLGTVDSEDGKCDGSRWHFPLAVVCCKVVTGEITVRPYRAGCVGETGGRVT